MRLSQVRGFVAEGDVVGVDWAIADGRNPLIVNLRNWSLPPALRSGAGPERIAITDELLSLEAGIAWLRPPSLVIGVHPAPDVDAEAIDDIITDALAAAGLARSSVSLIATTDLCRNDKAIRRLGKPVRSFEPRRLDAVNVPNPSPTLQPIVGSSSVCEAAALLAAGVGGRLLVERRKSPVGTVAIARRRPPADVIIDAGSKYSTKSGVF